MLDNKALMVFLEVARTLNMTKTANHLHITEPTVSRIIKSLEERLGYRLIQRSSKSLTLTKSGQLLQRRAQVIVDLVQDLESEFNNLEHQISGKINLGLAETPAFRLVAPLLVDIQRQHPQVQFGIESGNAEQVCTKLDAGLYDFGLVVASITHIENYQVLPLPCPDVWGVILPKNHPLAAKSSLSPYDLKDEPLLFSRQEQLASTRPYMDSDSVMAVSIQNGLGDWTPFTHLSSTLDAGSRNRSNRDSKVNRDLDDNTNTITTITTTHLSSVVAPSLHVKTLQPAQQTQSTMQAQPAPQTKSVQPVLQSCPSRTILLDCAGPTLATQDVDTAPKPVLKTQKTHQAERVQQIASAEIASHELTCTTTNTLKNQAESDGCAGAQAKGQESFQAGAHVRTQTSVKAVVQNSWHAQAIGENQTPGTNLSSAQNQVFGKNYISMQLKSNPKPDESNLPASGSSELQWLSASPLRTWFEPYFEQLKIVATFNLIYNAALLVESGMGLTLSIDGLIDLEQHPKLCFRPLNPPLSTPVALIWPRFRSFTPAARLLKDEFLRHWGGSHGHFH